MNSIQLTLWITNKFQYFSSFTILLSSMVISRFILALRNIYFSSTRPSFLRTQYSPPSQLSTVHFTWTEAESDELQISRTSHIIDTLPDSGMQLVPSGRASQECYDEGVGMA
ncbi:hypothetical protein OBBRIDRAFT_409444 [Obba rivulosa]|uniref:Uncharacterized protein n=1 Tax=Obba rivulosa TaxID=1052685 RepID=A0A8E2DG24_9APHY|nr:hypothetical protein OBBRIDRAFT_409444 [Obba rivulosa]